MKELPVRVGKLFRLMTQEKQHIESAYLAAFEENADALFRHASYRVSDRERARDLTQDTFLKTWDYLSGGGEIRNFKSFLYRTMHNLIIDEYRKKKSSSLDALLEREESKNAVEAMLAEGGRAETEEAFDTALEVKALTSQIKELPESYRAALTMRYIDDLSLREISDVTGESENVISVRIHRGVAQLKKTFTL